MMTLAASEAEIASELESLPLWERQGDAIVREFVAADFAAAAGLISSIAVLAESDGHHPDIMLYGWNKVRVVLSTREVAGLTELDFGLAKKIEKLNSMEVL